MILIYLVWAYNPDDNDRIYITQFWKAVNHYDKLLTDKPTMFIGYFNSNVIWDYKKHKLGNHAGLVKMLEDKGICSNYYIHHKQSQGKEQHPTFYMYQHKDKAYHIDYCFVSNDMIEKLQSVEVGIMTLGQNIATMFLLMLRLKIISIPHTLFLCSHQQHCSTKNLATDDGIITHSLHAIAVIIIKSRRLSCF